MQQLQEKEKKHSALTLEFGRLHKQNADTLEESSKLKSQLDTSKDEMANVHQQKQGLLDKLRKTEKEVEELETENNDLLAKMSEHKKLSADSTILRNENTKLLATIQELQSKPAVKVDEDALVSLQKEKATIQKELEEVKEKLALSKTSVDEWTALAQVK